MDGLPGEWQMQQLACSFQKALEAINSNNEEILNSLWAAKERTMEEAKKKKEWRNYALDLQQQLSRAQSELQTWKQLAWNRDRSPGPPYNRPLKTAMLVGLSGLSG